MLKRNSLLGAVVLLALVAGGSWLGQNLSTVESLLFGETPETRETVSTRPGILTSSKLDDGDADADFDFYVLALSWSPQFCATGGRDPLQCGAGRNFGFVTHGLWPQYERGFPADCQTSEPAEVSRNIEDEMLDTMPSRGLIRHQWRKHGTCSGLSQEAYFDKVRLARQSISVPPRFRSVEQSRRLSARDVENAFAASNPTLDVTKMAVRCDRGRVKEVRICLTKDLQARTCREVDARGCKQSGLELLPTR